MRYAVLLAAFFVSVVLAQSEPYRRAIGGLLPPFLRSVNISARKEFMKIVHSNDITVEQSEEQLKAWAAKQPAEFQEKFAHAKELLGERVKQFSETAEHSSEPQETKDALKELAKIVSEKQPSFVGVMRNTFKYMQSLPVQTRENILNFLNGLNAPFAAPP